MLPNFREKPLRMGNRRGIHAKSVRKNSPLDGMCEYIDDHTMVSDPMYVLIVEKALCSQMFSKFISESVRRTPLAMAKTHRDKSWLDHPVNYLRLQMRNKCSLHLDSQNS